MGCTSTVQRGLLVLTLLAAGSPLFLRSPDSFLRAVGAGVARARSLASLVLARQKAGGVEIVLATS